VPIRDELIERTVKQLAAMLARLLRSPGADAGAGASVLSTEAPSDVSGSAEGATEVTAKVTAEDLAAAREEVRSLYRTHLGTTPELLHRLDAENLLRVLSSVGGVDGERAYLIGALFSAEAEVERLGGAAADDTFVRQLRGRALDLMLEAALSGLGEADLPARVERLAAAVPPSTRTAATWARLHLFARSRAAFSRAEDALFAWVDAVEATHDDAEAVDHLDRAGIAFYQDLADRTEAELRAGGMERDEVAEGRTDFAERVRALRG